MARSPESDSSSAVGAVAKASTTPGGVIGGVLRELRADLRPRRLVTCLLVGVVCGVVGLVYAISAAAFIFSGPLAPYMVAGVGMLLFATITLSLITALGSSQAGIVGTTQDVALVSFAVIAAAIEADLTERDAAAQVLPTVVAAIGLSTLLCGLVFYLLGRFRLSRFVRFVPYPVIAGFLAGTGWLIIEGAFGVITGSDLSFEALPSFAEGSALAKIATAVVLAALLWAIGRYGRNAVVLPLVIVGAMALFHAATAAWGLSRESLIATGWLIDVALPDRIWPPLRPADVAAIDWQAVLAQAPKITSLLLLAPLALLMSTSGIELSTDSEMDMDRELKVTGTANVVAGLGGGVAGFHGAGLSTLQHKMGASSRLVGCTLAVICLATLLFGGPLLLLLPLPVLGGLLMWVGLSLLVMWLIETYDKLDRSDHLVVVLIVFVIGYFGFLEGVVVGLAAGITLFAIDCSRIDIVRSALSAKTYRSNVTRPEELAALLDEHGDSIVLFRLQGFMFFGTAHRLLRMVRERIVDAEQPPVHFLLLDFQRVTGIDSSAILSFTRIKKLADAMGLALVFTSLSAKLRRNLERGGLQDDDATPSQDRGIHYFEDLDHGLEWCEEQLLAALLPQREADARVAVSAQLRLLLDDEAAAAALRPLLERVTLRPGDFLTRQGEVSQDLFFIEAGQVTIEIASPQHGRMRLSSMSAGTLVGEMAFYLGRPRSTSMRADRAVVAWRLSRSALDRLRLEHPTVATLFHERIVKLLAQRLTRTNALLQSLAD